MFTLQSIQSAHAKVKSGADFPKYFEEIKNLGVVSYDVFVYDGHAEYYGNPDLLISPPKYDTLDINEVCNEEKFKERLKLHQSGGSDYMTFCRDCAENGIEKWTLDMSNRTCTYYDTIGNPILVESIPG